MFNLLSVAQKYSVANLSILANKADDSCIFPLSFCNGTLVDIYLAYNFQKSQVWVHRRILYLKANVSVSKVSKPAVSDRLVPWPGLTHLPTHAFTFIIDITKVLVEIRIECNLSKSIGQSKCTLGIKHNSILLTVAEINCLQSAGLSQSVTLKWQTYQ